MRNWDAILESHGRLDKTVYGENSVKVSQRQQWVFFLIFHVIITCISSSEGASLGQSHQIFYFLLFLLAFTSADIIFHKFLKIHSVSSVKKIFVTDFLFERIQSNPPSPHPLNGQNPLTVTKVFCRCSLILTYTLLLINLFTNLHSIFNLTYLPI